MLLDTPEVQQEVCVNMQKNMHMSNRNKPSYETVKDKESSHSHEHLSGFNTMDGERLATSFFSELHLTYLDHEDGGSIIL